MANQKKEKPKLLVLPSLDLFQSLYICNYNVIYFLVLGTVLVFAWIQSDGRNSALMSEYRGLFCWFCFMFEGYLLEGYLLSKLSFFERFLHACFSEQMYVIKKVDCLYVCIL
eukprot:TRINITY_DN45327_c0_g2_i1.p4 TRINITY_DN45327_c0_g2~~TRINITY_DN45327_c0_g2_i1.p4  ORF type:complete len:112 (-),score=3.89 TRINITY_DN45327_c0_g2_i1:157-492(-)